MIYGEGWFGLCLSSYDTVVCGTGKALHAEQDGINPQVQGYYTYTKPERNITKQKAQYQPSMSNGLIVIEWTLPRQTPEALPELNQLKSS